MVRARLRKKYSGPSHLWQMDRIKEEAMLNKKYGCKNKKEIWKMNSILRNFRAEARRLIPLMDAQAQLERKQLIDRLVSLGMVKEGAHLEDVLSLKIEDIMERRLQTIVLKKNFGNSIKQARQFITHGHVSVNGTKVSSPSMLIRIKDESTVGFYGNSAIANEMHPERVAGKEKRNRANHVEVKEIKKEPAKVEPAVSEEKDILESEA